MWFDYTKAKNETAAKKQAREDLSALLFDFLKEKFGEEGQVAYVNKNEIGFTFGDVIDKDGCPVYMVATVKPVIKNYQEHSGDKRTTEAFDFDQAVQDFTEEQAAKEK
jgi:hypothetical protein